MLCKRCMSVMRTGTVYRPKKNKNDIGCQKYTECLKCKYRKYYKNVQNIQDVLENETSKKRRK